MKECPKATGDVQLELWIPKDTTSARVDDGVVVRVESVGQTERDQKGFEERERDSVSRREKERG